MRTEKLSTRRALEHRAPDALHAGAHLAQRQDLHRPARLGERRGRRERTANGEAQPASEHRIMLGCGARGRNARSLDPPIRAPLRSVASGRGGRHDRGERLVREQCRVGDPRLIAHGDGGPAGLGLAGPRPPVPRPRRQGSRADGVDPRALRAGRGDGLRPAAAPRARGPARAALQRGPDGGRRALRARAPARVRGGLREVPDLRVREHVHGGRGPAQHPDPARRARHRAGECKGR